MSKLENSIRRSCYYNDVRLREGCQERGSAWLLPPLAGHEAQVLVEGEGVVGGVHPDQAHLPSHVASHVAREQLTIVLQKVPSEGS